MLPGVPDGAADGVLHRPAVHAAEALRDLGVHLFGETLGWTLGKVGDCNAEVSVADAVDGAVQIMEHLDGLFLGRQIEVLIVYRHSIFPFLRKPRINRPGGALFLSAALADLFGVS